MPEFSPLRRFSVDEYQWLAANGTFDEQPHVELLDGCIVHKKPKTPLHDGSVDLVVGSFRSFLNRGWYIRAQKLLIAGNSCPEPDVAIIWGRPLDYQLRHPQAAECTVSIEIADTDVERDRLKAGIYAHAGVPEFWLVNLVDWQLERMTQPSPEGRYQQTEFLSVKDTVPLVIAGTEVARLSLQELLTPPA